MPTYINPANLPRAYCRAVENDPYDPGDCNISITRLIAPVQQVMLLSLPAARELVLDVRSRVWALRSQGIHAVLERAADINEIAEERWYTECLGWRIGGKTDLLCLESGELTDWKDTSVWSVKRALDPRDAGKDVEWEQQVNLCAMLARERGYTHITGVGVVAFGRDWRKNERLRNGDDYPEYEVSHVPLRLWSEAECRAFLTERVRLHQEAQRTKTAAPCTARERYEQPTEYAVVKVGATGTTVKGYRTATRVYEQRALAEQYVADAKRPSDYDIEVRPGESTRCVQGYCEALGLCAQGKAYLAALDPKRRPKDLAHLIDTAGPQG